MEVFEYWRFLFELHFITGLAETPCRAVRPFGFTRPLIVQKRNPLFPVSESLTSLNDDRITAQVHKIKLPLKVAFSIMAGCDPLFK